MMFVRLHLCIGPPYCVARRQARDPARCMPRDAISPTARRLRLCLLLLLQHHSPLPPRPPTARGRGTTPAAPCPQPPPMARDGCRRPPTSSTPNSLPLAPPATTTRRRGGAPAAASRRTPICHASPPPPGDVVAPRCPPPPPPSLGWPTAGGKLVVHRRKGFLLCIGLFLGLGPLVSFCPRLGLQICNLDTSINSSALVPSHLSWLWTVGTSCRGLLTPLAQKS
jgi:hypothetical protein